MRGRDIDQVIAGVRERVSDVSWEQLKVVHPGADDDGIWFFRRGPTAVEVQVESWNGMCPFVVEWDATPERFNCGDVAGPIQRVVSLLSAKT